MQNKTRVWRESALFPLYAVSTRGEVRVIKTNKILKNFLNKDGYACITLTNKSGRRQTVKMHRLVAMTFIPNTENKPTVHHIDGNRANNNIENLEWRTYKEQSAIHFKRDMFDKPVEQLDLEGNRIRIWNSQSSASRVLGIPRSNINKCCAGKRKSAGGFMWRDYYVGA